MSPPNNPVVYLLIYHLTIYSSLSGLPWQIRSSCLHYYTVKTMIPLGIIILHYDEHHVFILTEGEGVRIVAELYIYVYL